MYSHANYLHVPANHYEVLRNITTQTLRNNTRLVIPPLKYSKVLLLWV